MNYNLIKQLNEVIMGKVIILGNFDGVHIGHQKLIQMAIDYAKNNIRL